MSQVPFARDVHSTRRVDDDLLGNSEVEFVRQRGGIGGMGVDGMT